MESLREVPNSSFYVSLLYCKLTVHTIPFLDHVLREPRACPVGTTDPNEVGVGLTENSKIEELVITDERYPFREV